MAFLIGGRHARRHVCVWLMAMATIAAVLITPALADADTFIWRNDADGNWDVPANWARVGTDPGDGFPNRPGDVAEFGVNFAALRTVTLPANRTIVIGGITYGGSAKVAIVGQAGSVLAFNSGSASSATISQFAPTPDIDTSPRLDVLVQLRSDLSVFADAGARLQLSRIEEDGARSLTKTGRGTLVLRALARHSRGTVVQDGVLELRNPAGASLFNSTLEIGDGTGDSSSAQVLAVESNQFGPFQVEVNSDGELTITKPNRVGHLVVRDGVVRDRTREGLKSARLTVGGVTMTGGALLAGFEGIALEGDVTATSSAAGPARIDTHSGTGFSSSPLDLLLATRTFTVNDGPGAVDLEVKTPVTGAGTAGLIKDGAGTLLFSRGEKNTYPGETLVRRGRLELARGPGTTAIPGPLRVGVGMGPAVVAAPARAPGIDRLSGNINSKSPVFVGRDGLIEARADQNLDNLTIEPGGHVSIGRDAGWSLGHPDGGRLTIAGGGRLTLVESFVLLHGALFASSGPAGPAVIDGNGTFIFNEGSGELSVADGPQAIDLRLDVAIHRSKTSDGKPVTLRQKGVTVIAGQSRQEQGLLVQEGTLLVTGTQTVGAIMVNGGILGGTGTVRDVTVSAAGTLSPGLSPGRFATGSVAFDATSKFAIELNGTSPGTGHDQIAVTGTVSLGNAALVLTAAALPSTARFTIIANDGADPIVGTFAGLAEGSAITLGGNTFTLSYRGGDGNDVVLLGEDAPPGPDPTPDPGSVTYYLAEGATGTFFDDDVLIANPNDTEAPVTLTFLKEGGATVVEKRTIAPQSRMTVHVDQIAGLEAASASVQVVSDTRVPLVVERSMFWDASYYGGHTANAVAQPETRWTFAEGSQGGFFDTYILIANANAEATTATLTFLREKEAPAVHTVEIGPFARKTIWAGDYPDVVDRAFGIVVEAPRPVIAERAMYFASRPGKLWSGGHVNTGIVTPSPSWFHAEGATGTFFSTFILLSNPQDTPANVELRFLLTTGEVITRTKTLAPRQRLTINPANEDDERLENAALSTVVQSDVPIVSERSMYWKGDAPPIGEGHNSAGLVSTALRWGLAEGRVGGPRAFITYILLANPSTTAAEVTITYLRESGAPIVKTYTVPATSRFNVDVNTVVPELLDASFGARIEVTNNVPIAVERSLYWDANNAFWAGGTNALATPLP